MMVKVPFMDLSAQYLEIKAEIDGAIAEIIANNAFIGGRPVKSFEDEFSAFCGVDHCVGVANGTDAIYIALRALGVGEGDEVITAANTFIASSEAITMAGAKPVFVDCLADTYCIDPELIEKAITPKTKVLLPVHLYGHPADMPNIMEIADLHDLFVVEDAAQAHGAEIDGKRIGSWGHAACFSFYPGKNLGAFGDAGAIVTNNGDLSRRMKMIANHGRISKYDHEFEGVNSRLDGMQAAILSVKLTHLEDWTDRRIMAADRYRELLAVVGCGLPIKANNVRHVHHLFVIQLEDRDGARETLGRKDIACGIHYPIGLPFLQAYEHFGHVPEDFPNTFALQSRILSLPLYPEITEEQSRYVCETLAAAIKRERAA